MTTAGVAVTEASPSLAQRAAAFRSRVEFGDLLLFFYIAAVARVYLWGVGDNRVAWPLVLLVSIVALYFYVATKEPDVESAGRPFWLLVALPLAFVYALRFVYPDISFDVPNYHIFQGERSLRAPLLLPGDFFPTPAPYNPTANIIHALFRHLLGYRLGTVFNLLALIWAGQIIEKLLRPYIADAWRRSAAVLLCLLAEHLLFEISTYMVDLVSLPLTLEATRLALVRDGDWAARRRRLVRVAFLLGLAAAIKLTNAAVLIPVVILCTYDSLGPARRDIKQLTRAAASAAAAFIAPLLPFCVFIYAQTGSPFFPLYNGIFRSPYWSPDNALDPRWGPQGVWEALLWPLLLPFRVRRLSELNVYSFRITLGFVAALAALLLLRRGGSNVKTLCWLLLGCASLWGLTMGYIRYGLHVEVLAGVVLVAVGSLLARGGEGATTTTRRRTALASALWVALAAQVLLACVFVSQNEWSGRKTFFHDPAGYAREARHLLRDHSLKEFVPASERLMYEGVDAWVVSGMLASGPQALLDPRVPFINVRTRQYFNTPAARAKFERALDRAEGRRVRSLCYIFDFGEAMRELSERGLAPYNVSPARLPFFTDGGAPNMLMFDVRRAMSGERFSLTDSRSPLGDEDYRAEIVAEGELPNALRAGESRVVAVRVRNAGRAVWPARGQEGGRYQFSVRARWLDAGGARTVKEWDGRLALYRDHAPGAELPFPLVVNAPQEPGEYLLEVDVVHEWVTSFREKGSRPLVARVSVGP